MNDILAIQNLLARFANHFDLKDWSALEDCLAPQVFTDYSDLRGAPPETLAAAEYVCLRREALAPLGTHHLLGNLEIDFLDSGHAICRASMLIWRVQGVPQGAIVQTATDEFHTHCLYRFELVRQDAVWKISGITQKMLWNTGRAQIHAGVRMQTTGATSTAPRPAQA